MLELARRSSPGRMSGPPDAPKRSWRPSPALVIACLALFVALGGTGYALTLPTNSVGTKQLRKAAVTSPDIRNGAVRAIDVANNSLVGADLRAGTIGAREIAESKLGTVPNAKNADTLGGKTSAQLTDGCPTGTVPAGGICIESNPRPATSWGQADAACTVANRHLLQYADLVGFLSFEHPVAAGGEFTSNVGESSNTPGQLVSTVILNNSGSQVEFIDATGNVPRAFRCGEGPSNIGR